MREISSRARSDSDSSIESEDGLVEETTGWEVEDAFGCRKEYRKISDNLVDYVNKRVQLVKLFQQSHLHFEERYSPSGWTHKRKCPFPDHRDKTPSFHFNPQEGRFFCFGCKRGGKAVQFLAFYKQIPIIAAAESLAETLGSMEDVYVDLQNETQDKIDEALLNFSNSVRNFVQKHKSYAAMEFAEKVTWSLDLYLTKHVSRSTMDESNLVARLNLLKEKIDGYAE